MRHPAPREGRFSDLVGVSGSKRPHEKEAFPISWGCPARSGPTRRKLFWSRGGLCGEPGPRQCRSSNSGFCTDTAANGEVMEPPRKRSFKNPRGRKKQVPVRQPPEKEVFKNPGVRKKQVPVRQPPDKEVLKNPRGSKEQVPGETAPRKQKIFHLGGATWLAVRKIAPTRKKLLNNRGVDRKKVRKIDPTRRKLYKNRGVREKVPEKRQEIPNRPQPSLRVTPIDLSDWEHLF